MAVPTNTVQSYAAVNSTREDLLDKIYTISPQETPFLSMAKRVTAAQSIHQWQTDALAAAATGNAQIEGDDASANAIVATNRIKNYTQISTKTRIVSGTNQNERAAGFKRQMAYQLMKGSAELKRDMEAILTGEHGSTVGGAATARQQAGLESWLSSNKTSVPAAAAATTPGYVTSTGLVTALTDGVTVGTITQAALKAIVRECWTAGGNPTVALCGGYNKQQISGFSSNATLYREATKSHIGNVIVGAYDLYISDFGELRIVPDRFSRDRTVCVLDMDYWAVAYLRPFETNELGRTGDSIKRQIVVEYCLESRNQASSGKLTDLATSG